MTADERKTLERSFLGKTVTVKIDRPIGYLHRKGDKVLLYPINYGFIPGVIGGDGEELDVYILGVDRPLDSFTGRVIAIVHRTDDNEDKLVAVPDGMSFGTDEIASAVHFQERFFHSHIELFNG